MVRGYLIAPVLALTLGILALAGIVRKVSAVVRRRTSGHIPVVVHPDRHDALVDQIDGILRGAGLVTGRRDGSRLLAAPARLLAAVPGVGLRRLVPDHLVMLAGPEVDLEVYPSDVSMTGTKLGLARARAAVLRDLDSQHGWFTTAEAAEAIEGRLAKLDLDRGHPGRPGRGRPGDRRHSPPGYARTGLRPRTQPEVSARHAPARPTGCLLCPGRRPAVTMVVPTPTEDEP